LKNKIARKKRRYAILEAQVVEIKKEDAQAESMHEALTKEMYGAIDALKATKVEVVNLMDILHDKQYQLKCHEAMGKKWAERCVPYDGQDSAAYSASKEAQLIKDGEMELEARFTKIYEDTIGQMADQYRKTQEMEDEKQRQNIVENQKMQADMKELRKKSKNVEKELVRLQKELAQISQEIQVDQEQLERALKELPNAEHDKEEQKNKEVALKDELRGLADISAMRAGQTDALRKQLKEKSEQYNKSREKDEAEIAQMRASVQLLRNRLDDSNIGLFPEISKYRGLVDVVEVKLTPEKNSKRRRTIL